MADDIPILDSTGATKVTRSKEIGGKQFAVGMLGDPTTGAEIKPASQADVAAVVSALGTPLQEGGSIDLPTGAATSVLQGTGNSALTAIVAALAGILSTAEAPLDAVSFYPGFTPPPNGETRIRLIDEYGAPYQRGGITTDEGSVRVGYAGSSISRALPGTPTFTNGSRSVTGTGFASADPQLLVGDYVKRDADGESAWAQIYSIDSDTALTLAASYIGTSGTSASSIASMKTTTGAGASLAVGGGSLTITCGTTASVTTSVLREVDYGPLIYQSGFSVSARDANRTVYRGFTHPSGNLRYFAHFKIDGTVATTLVCETGWAYTAPASGTDVQATTLTLPNGLSSATYIDGRIELRGEVCSFYVNDVLVAQHKQVLPRPYDVLSFGTIVVHGGAAPAAANVVVAYEQCNNIDSVRVSMANQTDNLIATPPIPVNFNYSQAGVIAINTDLLIIDCRQFAEIGIHCQSMGTFGVVTAAWSATPDFAGAQTATLYDQAGVSSTTFSAAVLRKVNRQAPYLRLRLTTATTAGVTTIIATGYPTASSPTTPTQPVSGTVTANIGTGSIASGTNLIGDVGVQVRANATGAASRFHRVLTGTDNVNVKASAGRLFAWRVFNASAGVRHLKLHNSAGTPTLGAGVVETISVPAGTIATGSVGDMGDAFTTGIAMSAVTGIADADTTAASSGDMVVDLYFA